MRTLVIHPDDRSTDFLKIIYEGDIDATVITGGITQEEVHKLIEEHDRIIMMGHGCPYGLFSVGKFKGKGLIIDKDTVPFLVGKENICIWCNADGFVKQFGVKGFYSGMFISEVEEAWCCGVENVSKQQVTNSNITFSRLLGDNIKKTLREIYENVSGGYGELAKTCSIANYNNKRLYLAE